MCGLCKVNKSSSRIGQISADVSPTKRKLVGNYLAQPNDQYHLFCKSVRIPCKQSNKMEGRHRLSVVLKIKVVATRIFNYAHIR
jgi:hypothetical protein